MHHGEDIVKDEILKEPTMIGETSIDYDYDKKFAQFILDFLK